MSFGVPAGAITPYQLVTSKPTMPSSSKVGTSGSCATRRGVEIASARSFPLLMCSTTGGMVSKFMLTTPASRSPIACPLPLYGHVHDVDAGELLEHLARQVLGAAGPRRGVVEPARLRLRERDQLLHRPRGHRRVDDEHVRHVADVRHRGEVLQRVVGQLAEEVGCDRVGVHVAHDQRVAVGRPTSRRRRRRSCRWRRRRFSTRTPCPHHSDSRCEITRATTSVPPPGGKPTIMRTGFVGYCCCAPAGAAAMQLRTRREGRDRHDAQATDSSSAFSSARTHHAALRAGLRALSTR